MRRSGLFFISILFAAGVLVFAQNKSENEGRGEYRQTQDEEVKRQIEEIMKARDEMLKSMLDDSHFGDMEKRMQDMMKRFGDQDFHSDFFKDIQAGEDEWSEDDKYRILKLKVRQIKDRPLDIKIEKGVIKIKGEAETTVGKKGASYQKMMFQRSYSIPQDVDQNNPVFENNEKAGEVRIKFTKLGIGSSQKGPARTETTKEQSKQEQQIQEKKSDRIPLPPPVTEGGESL